MLGSLAFALRSMKRLFVKNIEEQDFSDYLPGTPKSRKQLLLEACEKQSVPVYLDDPTESSSGIYAELRGVASEAELERRLNAKVAVGLARCANRVAIIALLISIIALIKSFL